jgi:NAD-dependent dihydropyrimidine dehydrogenase PreA subunit
MHKKRKRKSKQEVKERMEDEIIEQVKRINNSNNSVPAVCYKCEMKCEKYSLQENNDLILRQKKTHLRNLRRTHVGMEFYST